MVFETFILRSEFADDGVLFKIPDLNTSSGGSTEPVVLGGEADSIDTVTSVEFFSGLTVGKIPEADNTVLATRGTEGTIRSNIHAGNRSIVLQYELGLREAELLCIAN